MAANALRMRRLASGNGSILMVPLDHGVSVGPIEGIQDPAATLGSLAGHGATCITVHKGLVPVIAPVVRDTPDLGVLLHLSASTDVAPDPNDKRLVATVEEAVRLGCDGVSIHVNVGSLTEARQLEDAGRISTACNEWGLPLVAMMYPRGPGVKDPHDARLVAHAARLGAELGADCVKVPYTGKADTFAAVTDGCPVPVIVAGGPRRDSFQAFAKDIEAARKAGARGVSVGRNVFQHAKPAQAMDALARIFR